jgi:curved DNA-binding protein CbpA
VRRAFRRLASALHPDRLASAALEERQRQAARFAELSAAYHLLVA